MITFDGMGKWEEKPLKSQLEKEKFNCSAVTKILRNFFNCPAITEILQKSLQSTLIN